MVSLVSGLDRVAVEAYAHGRGEPSWLVYARLEAWDRFEALPTPTNRDPGWRHTDLAGLDFDRLLAAERGVTDSAAGGASRVIQGKTDEHSGFILLSNGQAEQDYLADGLAARGVIFGSLAEAVREQPDRVRPFLTAAPRPAGTKLDALAAALWDDGVFVYIPRGVELELPLQVAHWSDGAKPSFTRVIVVADEASSLVLVDDYLASEQRPESLNAATVELYARQAARVTYISAQERDEQSWNLASLHSEQSRDSALTWLLLGLGGRVNRTQVTAELSGQGAEADVLGLVFGDGDQHFDLHSVQDHVASDTRSDLLLKVALNDRAKSNFTGLIRVGQEALRTSSNQENRNLLLSPASRADSDPKLEILNSDVTRCGHGATVGPVDEELIFYLMSRGLPHDEAEQLIVEGFFDPLLARIPLESARKRLWAAIDRKLEIAANG